MNLQSSFDQLRNLLFVDNPGYALDLFSVLRNPDARRIAKQAAEFLGDSFTSDDDGIVHRKLLAVYVVTLFRDERRDHRLAFFIHRNSQNRETLGSVLVLHFD